MSLPSERAEILELTRYGLCPAAGDNHHDWALAGVVFNEDGRFVISRHMLDGVIPVVTVQFERTVFCLACHQRADEIRENRGR